MDERINVGINVESGDVKQLDIQFQKVDQTVNQIVEHLTQVENKILNITKNVSNVTNNVTNHNKKGTFIDNGLDTIVGAGGTAVSTKGTRSSAFKQAEQDYHNYQLQEIELLKQQVETEKEITRLKKELASTVQQEADTRSKRADASLEKSKYYNSPEHLYYEQGLGVKHNLLAGWYAAKSANPDKFLPGAQLRSWKYQTARMMASVGGSLGGLGAGGKILGGILDSAGAMLKSPAAGLMTTFANLSKAMIELGKASVQAYSEIQAIKTQLGVVFGNQTQADAVFGQISEYAVHSPFGVQQTSELAVLLKQSGVYASDLMDTLKMLGDTAGGNMEKMKRIANNYAQIVSIGKASMLDMRQFAYAGIPIFEAVSKELGVSQQQLRKLISDGKVTSDIIEKVFKDLTGINGIFNEATSKGAKTLKARLQNLSDAKQLALSGIGDWIVNAGTKTGNDSYVIKMVSWAENFYEYVKNNVNTKNIQRDVETIANRNDRIEVLRKLIDETKNKELKTTYQKELEAELAKRNFDEERNKYTSSYDSKEGRYERALQALEGYSVDNAFQRFSIISLLSGPQQGKEYANKSPYYDTYKDFTQQELEILRPLYAELIDAMRELGKITDEEVGANKESNLLAAQQLAFDQTNKGADTTSSLASSFQELTNIYKESDEYKEKQEKERVQRLEEALKVLKEIAVNTDETGKVDVSKFSIEDLYKYFTNNAFVAGKKLDVVPKNGVYDSESRNLLEKQYGFIEGELLAFTKSLGPNFADTITKLENKSIATLKDLDNEQFYTEFKNNYTETGNIVKDIKRSVNAEQLKKLNMITYLMDKMLSTVEADTEGKNATTEMINGSGSQFIPLWKRILAQATGLSAEGITTSKQTLENYRDDMAVRNLASGVMTEVMKNSDVTSAMQLIRASNQVGKLKGTSFEVVQIDWKSTREAVKNFALQLSASTSVISAYKNALEDELSTFQSLVAAGYTTPESQELKNQRYVSASKYARLMETAGSQLVNAFGERLVTKSGQSVWLREINGEGKFFDAEKEGNEVAVDELILTESMFEIIKKTLPKIEEELHEANATQLKNSVLEDLLGEVKAVQLQRFVNTSSANFDSKSAGFLQNNPEFLSKYFDSALRVVRNEYKTSSGDYGPEYKWLEGMSDNDILLEAMKGDESEHAEELARIIKRALEIISGDTENFLGSGEYSSLQDAYRRNAVNAAVNERLIRLSGATSAAQLSPSAWGDEGGYDMKSQLVKALTGVEKGYTMDDLYKGAANGGYLSEADRDALKFKETLQDTLDIMKDMGEATADLVGQLSQKAFLTPFEKMGECLITGEKWTEKTADAMEELGAEALSALGPIMAKAGFELVARGALNNSWGMIAGGLALAAAGGFASGIGGALTEGQKETKDNKQVEKLQNLKDQLADLLDQARRDALYYENNLRHKTALGMNKEFDYQSVNDAIITPFGDVIKTDPKDYLIATKTPNQLIGSGNVSVAPVINCIVNNNSGAHVTQQQQQNPDGSIDIITIIEDKFGEYIASPKSDDAFASREYRIRGQQAIMN